MKKLILSEKQYSRIKNFIVETAILNEQTKDEIMQVQQRLKDCFQADLGKSGPNKDGVDGICGEKTKAAIEKHTNYKFDSKVASDDDEENKGNEGDLLLNTNTETLA
jgi:hypothetical protein